MSMTQELTKNKLTEKAQKFVENYVMLGGARGAGTDAAIMAGYATGSAGQQAYALLHKQKILDAIREEVQLRLNGSLPLAFNVLEDLARTGTNSVRFKAVQELMNRGGMLLTRLSELSIKVDDNRNTKQLEAEVARLAKELGIGAIDVTPKSTYKPTGQPPGRRWHKQKLIPPKPKLGHRDAIELGIEDMVEIDGK